MCTRYLIWQSPRTLIHRGTQSQTKTIRDEHNHRIAYLKKNTFTEEHICRRTQSYIDEHNRKWTQSQVNINHKHETDMKMNTITDEHNYSRTRTIAVEHNCSRTQSQTNTTADEHNCRRAHSKTKITGHEHNQIWAKYSRRQFQDVIKKIFTRTFVLNLLPL